MKADRDPLPDATDAGPPPPGTRELAELPDLLQQQKKRRVWRFALASMALGALLIGLGGCRMNAHANELIAQRVAEHDAEGRMPGAAPVFLEAEGSQRAVLLIHGWVSTPADWWDLPQRLHERGVTVHAPLLPGHGTSPEDLAGVTHEQWLEAALAHYDALQSTHEQVCVAGFSMGGALAVAVAEARDAERLALMAPYFRVRDPWWTVLPVLTWARLVRGFVPYVDSGPDPVALNKRENADRIIKYRVLPLVSLGELGALGRRVRQGDFLARVTEPVLMVVSEGDRAASPIAATRAFELLGSSDKRLERVEDSDHQLLHDYDAEAVAAWLVDFLTET